MGLFSRKQKKADYDQLLKEAYKQANCLHQQARDEHDDVIKISLLTQVIEQYDMILNYIDQGAHQDRAHFESLKAHVQKDLEMVQSINENL